MERFLSFNKELIVATVGRSYLVVVMSVKIVPNLRTYVSYILAQCTVKER